MFKMDGHKRVGVNGKVYYSRKDELSMYCLLQDQIGSISLSYQLVLRLTDHHLSLPSLYSLQDGVWSHDLATPLKKSSHDLVVVILSSLNLGLTYVV